MGTPFCPPCVETPERWKWEEEGLSAAGCERWWELFADPALNALEEEALAQSPTLDKALARLRERWALVRIEQADNWPWITVDPSARTTAGLVQSFTPTDTVVSGGGTTRIHQQQFTLPLEASYTLDLWGKRSQTIQEAVALAKSSEEAWRSVWLTLTTDVASSYYRIRLLKEEKDVLERAIQARQEAFDVNSVRFDAGLIPLTAVSLAEREWQTTRAKLRQVEVDIAREEHLLATLIGRPAPEFTSDTSPTTEPPPKLASGYPSDMLLRRPDLAEALRGMQASHLAINIAETAFFPDFTLRGTVGLASPHLSDLFEWKARLWGWAVDVAYTLFDAGSRSHQVTAAREQYLQQVANYQEKVLLAFQEVENALSSLQLIEQGSEHLNKALLAAKETSTLTKERYEKGLDNYLSVVDVQKTELDTERAAVELISLRWSATFTLIKALGGI